MRLGLAGSQNAAYGAFVFKGLIIPPPRASPSVRQQRAPNTRKTPRSPWAAGALGGGSPGPGSQNAAYGAFVFKGLIIPPPRATPGREQPNQPVGDFRVFAGGTRGARKKPADRAGGGHAGCREIDTGGSVSDHTRTPARRAHGARGSVASGLPVSNEPTKKRPPYRAGSG